MVRNFKAIYIQALVLLMFTALAHASPGPELEELSPEINWAQISKHLKLKPAQLVRLQMLQSQVVPQIRRIHTNMIYLVEERRALVERERYKFKKGVYATLTRSQLKSLELEGDYGIMLGDPSPLENLDLAGVTETQRERARTILYFTLQKIAKIRAEQSLGRRERVSLIAKVTTDQRTQLAKILSRTQLASLREYKPLPQPSYMAVGDN